MKKFKQAAIIFYIIASVFFALGCNKMMRYSNPEHYGHSVNAYVGGDAYNYIINASYATGYYVIGGSCMLAGSIFACGGLITKALLGREETNARDYEELKETVSNTVENSQTTET